MAEGCGRLRGIFGKCARSAGPTYQELKYNPLDLPSTPGDLPVQRKTAFISAPSPPAAAPLRPHRSELCRAGASMTYHIASRFPDTAPAVPNRWLIAAASCLMQAALGSVYAASVFLPAIIGQYAATRAEATLVFTITILALGITAGFGGALQRRYGPRAIATAGGMLYGLGTALAAFAPNLPILYLTQGVVGGIGLGLGYIVPLAMLVRWFPDHRGLITGIAVFGFGAGAAMVSPLAAAMLAALVPAVAHPRAQRHRGRGAGLGCIAAGTGALRRDAGGGGAGGDGAVAVQRRRAHPVGMGLRPTRPSRHLRDPLRAAVRRVRAAGAGEQFPDARRAGRHRRLVLRRRLRGDAGLHRRFLRRAACRRHLWRHADRLGRRRDRRPATDRQRRLPLCAVDHRRDHAAERAAGAAGAARDPRRPRAPRPSTRLPRRGGRFGRRVGERELPRLKQKGRRPCAFAPLSLSLSAVSGSAGRGRLPVAAAALTARPAPASARLPAPASARLPPAAAGRLLPCVARRRRRRSLGAGAVEAVGIDDGEALPRQLLDVLQERR